LVTALRALSDLVAIPRIRGAGLVLNWVPDTSTLVLTHSLTRSLTHMLISLSFVNLITSYFGQFSAQHCDRFAQFLSLSLSLRHTYGFFLYFFLHTFVGVASRSATL
jgi:hypothetical protein